MSTPETVPAYGGGRIATGSSFWEGPFRSGHGTISTESGTLSDAPYTYASRFEGAPGANPEELVAAAYAACYNHALANISELRGHRIEDVTTTVQATMGRDAAGPAILALHVIVEATVPDQSREAFPDLAERARVGCAIAKALSVEATLEHHIR